MGANLRVLTGADKRTGNEIYKAVTGQPYYSPCLNTYHKNAIEIAKTFRALPEAKRQALVVECAQRMVAAKPDKLDNWENVVNETYYQMEKEPCGFLGLGRRTVRKKYTRPRAAAKPYLDALRGEAFHVIYREYEDEERDRGEDDYDSYILVTQSGRFLTLSYEVRFDYRVGEVYRVDLYNPGITGIGALMTLIHFAIQIAQVIGKDNFDQLARRYR